MLPLNFGPEVKQYVFHYIPVIIRAVARVRQGGQLTPPPCILDRKLIKQHFSLYSGALIAGP